MAIRRRRKKLLDYNDYYEVFNQLMPVRTYGWYDGRGNEWVFAVQAGVPYLYSSEDVR